MKKVLITGANSYIGTSFEKYAGLHYKSELAVDTVDMVDGRWREKSFATADSETGETEPYDCVFHVAGIAHADVGHVTPEVKQKYYAVNTDLAIETARKAKADGVGQFILMSSMIVYGRQEHIDRTTKPHPSNFYGDSKWKADKGVRKLRNNDFTVTVLRAPMIYGAGSKGNYPILSRLAKRVPAFPDYKNRRSMLYIENLCEFLAQVMIGCRGGVFFPQNGEYSSTSEIVREIATTAKKRVIMTKLLNPAVDIAKALPGRIGGMANKAFGDNWYEAGLSVYKGIDYQKISFEESIHRTEEGI